MDRVQGRGAVQCSAQSPWRLRKLVSAGSTSCRCVAPQNFGGYRTQKRSSLFPEPASTASPTDRACGGYARIGNNDPSQSSHRIPQRPVCGALHQIDVIVESSCEAPACRARSGEEPPQRPFRPRHVRSQAAHRQPCKRTCPWRSRRSGRRAAP
jgi:hypothetical protein